jgi:glutamate synthase (NADPH/NADH) small chain
MPGSEFIVKADTIIQALGQYADGTFLKQLGLKTDKKGRLKVKKNGSTSIPWVFGGGDVANGGATAVEAIAAGKLAAESIDGYVSKKRK